MLDDYSTAGVQHDIVGYSMVVSVGRSAFGRVFAKLSEASRLEAAWLSSAVMNSGWRTHFEKFGFYLKLSQSSAFHVRAEKAFHSASPAFTGFCIESKARTLRLSPMSLGFLVLTCDRFLNVGFWPWLPFSCLGVLKSLKGRLVVNGLGLHCQCLKSLWLTRLKN